MLLLCLGLTASFAYHTKHGRHGLDVRSTLLARSTELERRVRELEAVRARLAADVALLGARPDADLVAELAQSYFGFVRPGVARLDTGLQPSARKAAP